MIIPLIIFALTIAGKLYFDLTLYFREMPNYHTIGPAIVLILLSVCIAFTKRDKWLSIPMWFFSYWVLFDSLYGLFIGQGLFYIGTTAKLDILQHDHPILQIFKYVLAVSSVLMYFLLRKPKSQLK